MKLTLVLALLLLNVSAFAGWNEVECDGSADGKSFKVEIEQAFPSDAYYKDAVLTVSENGENSFYTFAVTTRVTRGFPSVIFSDVDFRLEVDFWPDQRPRWGSTYRANLRSSALGAQSNQQLNCTFPNAQ